MLNKDYYDIFEEVFESNQEFHGTLIEKHIKKLQELDEFMPPTSSFFILTNTTQNNYPFVSKNFEYNLGLDRERMRNEGVAYWFSHHHPDDLPIWMKGLEDLMVFTMTEVAHEDRYRMSYTWNYRVRTVKGDYLNIFEHQIPSILDENYKPVVGIAHATIIGEGQKMPIKVTAKILNENNEYETLFVRNYAQKMLTEGLSIREMDIIKLLALNKTSKDIAEKLFISAHTVDTHRRNIIRKLNVSSTGEIVAYVKANLLY